MHYRFGHFLSKFIKMYYRCGLLISLTRFSQNLILSIILRSNKKQTNLTNMLDVHTSQYPQNLILSIILRSTKKQQIPNAYSSGTQAKRSFSVDRKHCIRRISIPTILKESRDLPLRATKRFASYQRLVCKSESKRRHSTHIIASTPALLKKAKRASA